MMYIVNWCPELETGWKCTHSYSPEGRWHSGLLPTLQNEKLGCRTSPGNRCFRWSMFICHIFPTLPCCSTLSRPSGGSVGEAAPLWSCFACSPWAGWSRFSFSGESRACVREQPATHAFQDKFLFRIILGMTWWKTASFKETKNPLQNTQCGTVSCLVQWHHHCHSVKTTKHELLRVPVEWRSPSPFPHAPACCHSCFSECSSEGLLVAYPRFGVLVSSPPPTSCSLRQHLHAEICLAPKWSQVSLPQQSRWCWREESGWLGVKCNQPCTEGVSFFWFFKIEVGEKEGDAPSGGCFKKNHSVTLQSEWL